MNEYTQPELARSVSDTQKKIFCELSIQRLWHFLFDYAPTVDAIVLKERIFLFESFLTQHFGQSGKLSWQTPLHFLDFLSAHGYANDNIARELALNCVRYWAKFDKSESRYLYLFLKNSETFLIASKATGFTSKSAVKILKAREPLSSRHAYLVFENDEPPSNAIHQREGMLFI